MAGLKLNSAIQFYASPAELGGWVREWIERFDLHFLFARLFFRDEEPKFVVCPPVAWEDASAVAEVVRDYSQLYLSVVPLQAKADSINHLPLVNPDHLHVNLPEITPRGLTAISFGSVCRVPNSLKVYRAIARDLLARTEEGVWFRQEGHKKQRLDRGFRFAPGAAALLEHGIPLCGGGRMIVGRLGIGRQRARRAEPIRPCPGAANVVY
jgi:hypothetical protein